MTDLLYIPGVGKSIKKDLIDMGYDCVESLQNKNPEFLYQKLCVMRGKPIDRCVLYVFRYAIYYANNGSNKDHLRWWDFKDKEGFYAHD